PEPRQPLRSHDPGRHERHLGSEGDPGCARAPASLVLLPNALPPAGALREHHDRVSLAYEGDSRRDPLVLRAPAPPVSIASSSDAPRRTLNAPPARMTDPSGNQKSSAFAMKRKKRRGKN